MMILCDGGNESSVCYYFGDLQRNVEKIGILQN